MRENRVIGRERRHFSVIGSTNDYLKEQALAGAPDGLAVTADHQTAGRGRMERTFQSPAGQGIYLSVLLRPNLPPERFLPVTALAGVAVCAAVERVCGLRPGVKWPNDPVLGNRKLCGILTELVMDPEQGPAVVLGIGLNVLQSPEDFSPEVAEIATSLYQQLGRPVDREALTTVLLEELDDMYGALKTGDVSVYLAAYRQICVNLGRQVQLLSGDSREVVTAVDVDEAFGLVIRRADGGEETVRTGEVSVRGLYGYVE